MVARFEPDTVHGSDAARLVELVAEGERLCTAGRTLAARRVEEANAWRQTGHRSAAHWMAAKVGTSVGQAVGTLQTARCLEHAPATAAAFRSGMLSETQAREIATAAAAAPSSEPELLRAASTHTVAELRERCRRVRSAAVRSEVDAYERIRASRYLRHWTDHDGAGRLDVRTTADALARIVAKVDAVKEQIFHEARAQGRREGGDAYAADALLALVDGKQSAPSSVVHVRVDHAALVRGYAEEGECCDIPGVGPVPVATARALANDAVLKVLVTDGTDVRAVAHAGRTIPARLRTALEARDPVCVVPGCDVRRGLEIDHRLPWAEGGLTELDNLVRLCGWHHYLKTHAGYRLTGGPGEWSWSVPTEDGGPSP